MPSSEEVFRILRNMGERGLLARFPAVVFGTAKATSIERPVSPGQAAGRTGPRSSDAVLAAFEAYNPEAMIVFNVDIGHTDPQWVLPYGGTHDRRRPGLARSPRRTSAMPDHRRGVAGGVGQLGG